MVTDFSIYSVGKAFSAKFPSQSVDFIVPENQAAKQFASHKGIQGLPISFYHRFGFAPVFRIKPSVYQMMLVRIRGYFFLRPAFQSKHFLSVPQKDKLGPRVAKGRVFLPIICFGERYSGHEYCGVPNFCTCSSILPQVS